MKPWTQTLSALTALATLTSCNEAQLPEFTGPDAEERAFFETMLASDFKASDTSSRSAVDFAAAFADLPDGVSLQTGDVSFEPATGATRVEKFAIVYDLDGTGVGVEADEVLFYGFDPDAIAARIRGSNLDATVTVAERIEMRGVKSIGMDAVSKMVLDEYIGAIDEFTPVEDEFVDQMNTLDMFNYNFSIETLMMDGLVLEAFEYAEPPVTLDETGMPVASTDPDAEDRLGFQMIGAFMRAFSLDAAAYKNMSIGYEMRDENIEMAMDMTLALSGMKDYQRGDLGYSASWDALFDTVMPFPSEDLDGPDLKNLPMTGKIAFAGYSDMRLAKAFKALADWNMPDKSETDFMDFGRWEISDYTIDLAGKSLFKIGEFSFDSEFHWLLPTTLELSLTDGGYHISELIEVFTQEMGEELDSEIPIDDLIKGLAIAKEYGFGCYCGDFTIAVNWDDETGDITYAEDSRFADAFTGANSADLGFSTPAKIAALFEEEDIEAAFEDALKQDAEFRSLEVTMTDIGGLTNLFAMLDAIGDAFPDRSEMAMLTYNDAEQLRAFAKNSAIGLSPMLEQQMPGSESWMTAIAAFIEEGGTLSLAAKPAQPINADLIESLQDEGFDPEPEDIIELLGLTVSHTK
ncbi:MAG: hypothetical protein AAFR51_10695 [Pseudomonadota bacterium]